MAFLPINSILDFLNNFVNFYLLPKLPHLMATPIFMPVI